MKIDKLRRATGKGKGKENRRRVFTDEELKNVAGGACLYNPVYNDDGSTTFDAHYGYPN